MRGKSSMVKDMAKENTSTLMEESMMETGSKVKSMDMASFTIEQEKSHMMESGRRKCLTVMGSSIMMRRRWRKDFTIRILII